MKRTGNLKSILDTKKDINKFFTFYDDHVSIRTHDNRDIKLNSKQIAEIKENAIALLVGSGIISSIIWKFEVEENNYNPKTFKNI